MRVSQCRSPQRVPGHAVDVSTELQAPGQLVNGVNLDLYCGIELVSADEVDEHVRVVQIARQRRFLAADRDSASNEISVSEPGIRTKLDPVVRVIENLLILQQIVLQARRRG